MSTVSTAQGHFNPRAPRGARQQYSPVLPGLYLISIHVPREGHDGLVSPPPTSTLGFQSTCPARGTTYTDVNSKGNEVISIHVPREGHDQLLFSQLNRPPYFNPRAPRGARLHAGKRHVKLVAISIHVPREGHDRLIFLPTAAVLRFQSTCPARGTTASQRQSYDNAAYFNPRAPRGARRP